MAKLRLVHAILLAFCSAILTLTAAVAQMPLPAAKPPDGATLFKQQCATCHTIDPTETVRQGPALSKIIGRQARPTAFTIRPASQRQTSSGTRLGSTPG